jgi:hypothetical protein
MSVVGSAEWNLLFLKPLSRDSLLLLREIYTLDEGSERSYEAYCIIAVAKTLGHANVLDSSAL